MSGDMCVSVCAWVYFAWEVGLCFVLRFLHGLFFTYSIDSNCVISSINAMFDHLLEKSMWRNRHCRNKDTYHILNPTVHFISSCQRLFGGNFFITCYFELKLSWCFQLFLYNQKWNFSWIRQMTKIFPIAPHYKNRPLLKSGRFL